MLWIAVGSLGGWSSALAQVHSARWSLLPSDEGVWQQVDRWSIPIFGSLVAQELIAHGSRLRRTRAPRAAPHCRPPDSTCSSGLLPCCWGCSVHAWFQA